MLSIIFYINIYINKKVIYTYKIYAFIIIDYKENLKGKLERGPSYTPIHPVHA